MRKFLELSSGAIIPIDGILMILYNEPFEYPGSWGCGKKTESWNIFLLGEKIVNTTNKQDIDKILNNMETT